MRANRYAEAGAELIFVEALTAPDHIRRVRAEIKAPLLANMTEFGRTPQLSLDEWRAFGYEVGHYDVSVAVAKLELIPALAANPEALVVATGTSCRHQIRDLTGRTALHPLEVLAGGT